MPAPEGPSRLLVTALAVTLIALVGVAVVVFRQSARLDALEAQVAELEGSATVEPAGAAAVLDAAAPMEEACTGTIAQALVQESVGRHGTGVFGCYEEMRAEKPDFEGTLILDLEVDARGRVSDADLGGTLDEEPFLACIRSDLGAWRFPPPVGGECAIVRAPFALSAPPAD